MAPSSSVKAASGAAMPVLWCECLAREQRVDWRWGGGIRPFLPRALIECQLYVRPREDRKKPWILGDGGGSWDGIKAGDGGVWTGSASSIQERGKYTSQAGSPDRNRGAGLGEPGGGPSDPPLRLHPQGGRRHQTLRHLPHSHGLWLRRTLQPVRVAEGAGAALPARLAGAAQRRAHRHTCPSCARPGPRAPTRPPLSSEQENRPSWGGGYIRGLHLFEPVSPFLGFLHLSRLCEFLQVYLFFSFSLCNSVSLRFSSMSACLSNSLSLCASRAVTLRLFLAPSVCPLFPSWSLSLYCGGPASPAPSPFPHRHCPPCSSGHPHPCALPLTGPWGPQSPTLAAPAMFTEASGPCGPDLGTPIFKP